MPAFEVKSVFELVDVCCRPQIQHRHLTSLQRRVVMPEFLFCIQEELTLSFWQHWLTGLLSYLIDCS